MKGSHNFFYIASGGFIAGVAFRSFTDWGVAFAVFVSILSVAVFLYSKIVASQMRPRFFCLGLFLFAAGLGILRFDLADLKRENPHLEERVGETVFLTGDIVSEPDVRENSARLTVELKTLLLDSSETRVRAKAMVTAPLQSEFGYGDKVKIKGKLEKPRNFSADQSAREFDYISYLAKDGIYYTIFMPEIEIVSSGGGNFIARNLLLVKNKFIQSLSRLIPEPNASLLGGLVVGAKQSLGDELLVDFRTVGLIHIVVLSGYNLTIIAVFLMWLGGFFLPYRANLLFGTLGIILFTIMTGASATIVRASIMAILALFARASARSYEIKRALVLAGLIMVFVSPKILIFDPSFQLSFIATVSLIYLAPILGNFLTLLPDKFKLRETVTATVSTQIFVLPLLLLMSGELSVFALPVNILVLFFIPITMLVGFLAGFLGIFSYVLALPFAYAAFFLLEYILGVVSFFASLPFASVHISRFPSYLMIIIYVLYSCFIVWYYSKFAVRKSI
ncbi:MAG: ComEC/Rec2 family competence protein [bacterium]|nr:ComEC/Rec2 family competence protein [bacterium]